MPAIIRVSSGMTVKFINLVDMVAGSGRLFKTRCEYIPVRLVHPLSLRMTVLNSLLETVNHYYITVSMASGRLIFGFHPRQFVNGVLSHTQFSWVISLTLPGVSMAL